MGELTLLEEAERLDRWGLNVLPAKYRGKRPIVKWDEFQSRRSTPQLAAWFRSGRYNLWIACGSISGVVVLDIDSDTAETFWQERLGQEMLDTTTMVVTGSGKHHYYFRLADGDTCASWAVHEGDLHFDVRGDGMGVIAPPSIHESGGQYEWVRDPEHMLPLPNALRSLATARDGAEGVSALDQASPTGARSMLAQILAKPPGKGGRNDWLTKVAGHLAKMVPFEDGYRGLLQMANQSLGEPLDDEEFEKTCVSIWSTEQKRDRGGEPNEANGWLQSDGHKLYTYARRGKGDDAEVYLAPWSDFDLTVIGVIEDEMERSYSVEVVRGDDRRRDLLEANTLGRPAELNVWLAKHGATVIPPTGDMTRGSISARLQRYIESQDAPRSTAIHHLGWHDEVNGFVVHEGIIQPNGMQPHGGVMPHPILKDWAPYRYGFVDPSEASEVLAKVLTYHDPTVTAVFGAWWASCFLKAHIMGETALFPFMALEAPSESGKTTGYFSLMMALNGSIDGHGEYTLPVLRDRASAHRNGIVWVDDMSDPSAVLDLLRQVTGEGSRSKKGADRRRQETVRLVAPVVISGEGLGALEVEKALLDRAVKLKVGSPKGRMSLLDPTRPQWDDIKDLTHEWEGDLTQMSGTLVQMALAQISRVKDLRTLRVGTGRHADKIAILRLGARVLAEMAGDDWVIPVVDTWCEDAPDIGNENVLTTQILPHLLARWEVPTRPAGHVPVWQAEDGVVWFSEEATAEAWRTTASTPREKQLGSLPSIRMQREVLGANEKKRFSILANRGRGDTDTLRTYYALDAETSASVVLRTGMQRTSSTGVARSTETNGRLPLKGEG